MSRIIVAIFVLCFSNAALANQFAVETAHDHIDITVGFTGSSIELFGDRRDPGTDIAIVVEGPEKDVTIWKKERVMGAWVNRHSVQFQDIPVYYHYAVSAEETNDKLASVLLDNAIGHEGLFKKIETKTKVDEPNLKIYEQAMIDKNRAFGAYFDEPAKIKFINDNFFRVRFDIPASAPTGNYKIRSFLIKDGKILEETLNLLKVEQVGVNALVYLSAHEYSLLYACVCIMLALFSGWIVSVLRVKP